MEAFSRSCRTCVSSGLAWVCSFKPSPIVDSLMRSYLPTVAHFSENAGYLAVSPIVAENLFSIAFGHTLDAHGTSPSASLASPTSMGGRCMVGRACYVEALYLTMGACFVAIVLSICAGWRDRKLLRRGLTMSGRRIEVIWKENDE
ncbi:hypothetical protein FPV67DRAFT_383108 [Lyophyllum atratum]|nr:hypothetical protein FPV67DRAFT_383108 [Lyophyllum atratum]